MKTERSRTQARLASNIDTSAIGDDLHELRLDNRVMLITGGARGLGLSIANLLARRGAKIGLFDRDPTQLEDAQSGLRARGFDVLSVCGDVTRPIDCERVVDTCIASWGRLDGLVNSAGIGGRNAPVWEIEDGDWQAVIDVDLNGTFYATRAAVRRMLERKYGRIVNIASIAGKEGNANSSHYSAAKAGVIGFTKSIGKELANQGILVNAIAPALIETEILTTQSPEHVHELAAKIPMGRLGRPEEVARLAAFLLSDHLSFSTGAIYDLSGGRATY